MSSLLTKTVGEVGLCSAFPSGIGHPTPHRSLGRYSSRPYLAVHVVRDSEESGISPGGSGRVQSGTPLTWPPILVPALGLQKRRSGRSRRRLAVKTPCCKTPTFDSFYAAFHDLAAGRPSENFHNGLILRLRKDEGAISPWQIPIAPSQLRISPPSRTSTHPGSLGIQLAWWLVGDTDIHGFRMVVFGSSSSRAFFGEHQRR